MSLVRALLVRVLVGSGYLHTLNLVSLIGVSWLVWLPTYLEPRVLAGWCVPGWCVLVGSDYLHALNLVSLLRALLVRVLVGSDYLHALNLVSWLVWLVSWL